MLERLHEHCAAGSQRENAGRRRSREVAQIILLHPYIGEDAAGFSYLPQVDKWLTAAGCPAGRSIVFGETDILQQDATSQSALADVQKFLAAGGRPIETVFQWPEYLGETRPQLDATALNWR